MHDLAVGVHPAGADAWAQQEYFARRHVRRRAPGRLQRARPGLGAAALAPRPRSPTSGYAPYRALLRGLFRYAGALRIDHVMGLFRLWWVPEGAPPTEGTYVRYDAEAMLAVLALEASRAGAVVIGEDLGTVEPGRARGAARTRGARHVGAVVRAGLGGRPAARCRPERWRADCLATATTHDLPPTAARLTGDHVELRDRLGLLTRPAGARSGPRRRRTRRSGWTLLGGSGCCPRGRRDASEEAEIQAVHRFLLRTPARMIGVWLPDAVGDRRPQNLPGTWDQYPNWRLPIADAEGRPVTLEELAASPARADRSAARRSGRRRGRRRPAGRAVRGARPRATDRP